MVNNWIHLFSHDAHRDPYVFGSQLDTHLQRREIDDK